MKYMRYRTIDAEFQKQLKELIEEKGGIIDVKLTRGGRTTPGSIEEIIDNGSKWLFLTNDSNYASSYPNKNRKGYVYCYAFLFSDSNNTIDCDFATILGMSENPKYITIGPSGEVGSFDSLEKVGEYITKNPASEFKFYEVTNEIKPKIEVKFE